MHERINGLTTSSGGEACFETSMVLPKLKAAGRGAVDN